MRKSSYMHVLVLEGNVTISLSTITGDHFLRYVQIQPFANDESLTLCDAGKKREYKKISRLNFEEAHDKLSSLTNYLRKKDSDRYPARKILGEISAVVTGKSNG